MKTFKYSGDGFPLHFLHANGYPPNCYKPLFDFLKTEYHVFGMLLRPLWDDAKPEDIKSWHPFSDDLLRFLAKQTESGNRNGSADPVIGVGHSIGAIVTLRAALRDPGKFRALVLIEPVLFVPSILIISKILRTIGIGDRTSLLIDGAMKRRRSFDDLETIFRGYRTRKIFRYMSNVNLWAYIEGITKPAVGGDRELSTQEGYALTYSPEWEAQIYRTGLQDFDIWRDLPNIEVPTLFIRGEETDTFLEGAARLVKRKQPKVRVETLERSTHILPLEYPKEVFNIMRSFLNEVL